MAEEELNSYQRYYPIGFIALLTLGVGTAFYHFFEKFSWLDAWYFSVVTLATVGYGDITPHTALGKLFTTFYILTGVGIIAAFANALIQKRQERFKNKKNKT